MTPHKHTHTPHKYGPCPTDCKDPKAETRPQAPACLLDDSRASLAHQTLKPDGGAVHEGRECDTPMEPVQSRMHVVHCLTQQVFDFWTIDPKTPRQGQKGCVGLECTPAMLLSCSLTTHPAESILQHHRQAPCWEPAAHRSIRGSTAWASPWGGMCQKVPRAVASPASHITHTSCP